MSCTTTRRIDAQLEAAEARWGRSQCRTWTAIANTANVLEDSYLDLNLIGYDFAEDLYYVWFNGGTGVDPAVSGQVGIEVTITSGDAAAVVAAAIKTAVDAADVPVVVEVTGADVALTNQVQGAVTVETDSGSTGFTLAVGTVGFSVELGATEGAIELSLNTETVPITSNQTGSITGSEIYVGSSAEISMSLIEITKARFDTLVGEVTGDSVTPVSGTKVSGFGESRLFQALDELGGQLILHPIRLADSDKSSDVIFWSSAPLVESLNFDGQAAQAMSLTFKAYLDRTQNTAINLFAKGDWTQKGLTA